MSLLAPAVRYSGGFGFALKKALKLYKTDGFEGIKRGFRYVAQQQGASPTSTLPEAYVSEISPSCNNALTTRVLIIAEMSIEQCKKYRVQQKTELLALLAIDSTAISWTDTLACHAALQTHSTVIFYRVPAFPSVMGLISEAKRLGITTVWEVDDLIFDRDILAQSRTLAALDTSTYQQLLSGADLYRNAMLLCDAGIASTVGLANAMKAAGLGRVEVVENALDQQTLQLAATALAANNPEETQLVRLVYGSGTNTHNIDFLEAEAALLAVLGTFPNVRLRIVGELDLPDTFKKYQNQLELVPKCSYSEYLVHLAACQINLAPLENYVFNNAKSNIKYIEASILKIPSVCSPRDAFAQVITNGVNAYLCDTPTQWEHALVQLITDPVSRTRMGEAAYAHVMQHYQPENIARQQLRQIFPERLPMAKAPRILSVNCYYAPRSFGGATIVAEEVNRLVHASSGACIFVFTALPISVAPPYTIRHYAQDGIHIFGVGIPDHLSVTEQYDNQAAAKAFDEVLLVVKPDLVHFHSIQGLGVSLADRCIQQGVKYLITLHDAWWLCGRQFMVNKNHKYCGQVRIDLKTCASCVDNALANETRQTRLTSTLRGASALLSPSKYFADFYAGNGWPEVKVNKNGIKAPTNQKRHRQPGSLRFGYVGGNTEIKGFHLVKKVFSGLRGHDVVLILVDNAVNLGFKSYSNTDLKDLPGTQIVPAYTQKTIDEFFGGIDVLLFPTQWKESFGLTVREALARNVWVIATDAGGVVEDIEPGRNGLIVPLSDDGTELALAVDSTIRHFEAIEAGSPIDLGADKIRYFEEQAAELTQIYRQIALSLTAPARDAQQVDDTST